MTAQSFQLVMRQGPTPGKVYELTQNEIMIGRDINNTIVINDAEVSRQHARLVQQGGGYMLEDLGSTNGSFVNERRLTGPRSLRPGETVRLGETITFLYEQQGADINATAAAERQTIAEGPPPPQFQQPQPPPAVAPPPVTPVSPPPQPAPPRPEIASGYAGQVPAGPAAPSQNALLRPRNVAIGCGVILLFGICVLGGVFWYIDSNFLWCDIFGGLIPACGL